MPDGSFGRLQNKPHKSNKVNLCKHLHDIRALGCSFFILKGGVWVGLQLQSITRWLEKEILKFDRENV
jgi:hypothetical protein